MSTINPLIDTLLHQVLGKGGPPANQPSQNVPPVNPGDGPRALQSDSRLNHRPPPHVLQPATTKAGRTPEDLLEQPRRSPSSAGQLVPASAQTRLSSAGQAIAQVLARFPAPPTVLSTPTPLLSQGEALQPAQITEELQQWVRHSGLSYEARVREWYQGQLSLRALQQQPQAQLPTTRQELPENIQQLVRQQLELLTQPMLRLDGELFPGFYFALAAEWRRPDANQQDQQETTGQPAADEDSEQWQTRLQIASRVLGKLEAQVNREAHDLQLHLSVADSESRSIARDRLDTLRQRLAAHGVAVSQLTLGELTDE